MDCISFNLSKSFFLLSCLRLFVNSSAVRYLSLLFFCNPKKLKDLSSLLSQCKYPSSISSSFVICTNSLSKSANSESEPTSNSKSTLSEALSINWLWNFYISASIVSIVISLISLVVCLSSLIIFAFTLVSSNDSG